MELVDSAVQAADQAQALVLVTEWDEVVNADWEDVSRRMLPPRFVFDGRNALDARLIERLGFEYVGVGRNVTRVSRDVLEHRQELLSRV